VKKHTCNIVLLTTVLMLAYSPASGSVAVQPVTLAYSRVEGWIQLHRPDGEAVHVRIDHIVFVMNTANLGSDKRAQAKLQLVKGFCDVRESVDEVMQLIKGGRQFVG
jgi:hypothetical protein